MPPLPPDHQLTIAENLRRARNLVQQIKGDQEFALLRYNLKPDGRRVMSGCQPLLEQVLSALDSALGRVAEQGGDTAADPSADVSD